MTTQTVWQLLYTAVVAPVSLTLATVDRWWTPTAFMARCKKAPSRTTRHHAVNDVIARSLTAAGILVRKELSGLTRTDGKRSGGPTLIPGQAGKPLTWDVMVVSTPGNLFSVVTYIGFNSVFQWYFDQRNVSSSDEVPDL